MCSKTVLGHLNVLSGFFPGMHAFRKDGQSQKDPAVLKKLRVVNQQVRNVGA